MIPYGPAMAIEFIVGLLIPMTHKIDQAPGSPRDTIAIACAAYGIIVAVCFAALWNLQ